MTGQNENVGEREWPSSEFAAQLEGLVEHLQGFADQFEGFETHFEGFAERFENFPERFGDRLCLDFVNTLESPLGPAPVDHLGDVDALALWGRRVALLDEDGVVQVIAANTMQPDAAQPVFARAIALREALRRMFRAIARDEVPRDQDLATLKAEFIVALAASRLVSTGGNYHWLGEPADLERVIGAVAVSAVDVLTDDDLARVKECPGADDCGHLFFDTSKNGRRRWCSMLTCGSRVKMRQWYSRQRDQERRTPRPPHPPRPSRGPRKVGTPARTHPSERSQEE